MIYRFLKEGGGSHEYFLFTIQSRKEEGVAALSKIPFFEKKIQPKRGRGCNPLPNSTSEDAQAWAVNQSSSNVLCESKILIYSCTSIYIVESIHFIPTKYTNKYKCINIHRSIRLRQQNLYCTQIDKSDFYKYLQCLKYTVRISYSAFGPFITSIISKTVYGVPFYY